MVHSWWLVDCVALSYFGSNLLHNCHRHSDWKSTFPIFKTDGFSVRQRNRKRNIHQRRKECFVCPKNRRNNRKHRLASVRNLYFSGKHRPNALLLRFNSFHSYRSRSCKKLQIHNLANRRKGCL